MTLTMQDVAGWLREEARRVYEGWVDLIGPERASEKAEKWEDRAAQVEGMGWRPIEEAPKDGTHFIGLIGGLPYDVHCREYIEGWKETGKSGWVSSGKKKLFFLKETSDSIMPCKPTHWIPLPQPPVKK